jgi:putative ABC transport system permease protein
VFANRINFNDQTDEIRYGDAHVERFFLRGVQPAYINAFPLFAVAEGRFISAYDEEHARNVIVIGRAIADSLFPSVDPLGKPVRLNGRLYEVVGVFEPDQGLFSSFGVDQFACIPMSNFRKSFPEIRERFIAVASNDGFSLDTMKGQVEEALRRKRHVPHNAEDDFEITSPDFLSSLWNQLTGAMVLLTGIISGVGLLVGGIGVMNIMLISVTERTERDRRPQSRGRAQGGYPVQFLLEAITLSCIGGVIGILVGALIAHSR